MWKKNHIGMQYLQYGLQRMNCRHFVYYISESNVAAAGTKPMPTFATVTIHRFLHCYWLINAYFGSIFICIDFNISMVLLIVIGIVGLSFLFGKF